MEYVQYAKSKRGIFAIILFCIFVAQLATSLVGVLPDTRNDSKFAWINTNINGTTGTTTIWKWFEMKGDDRLTSEFRMLQFSWFFVVICVGLTLISTLLIGFGAWMPYILTITLSLMCHISADVMLVANYFRTIGQLTPVMYVWSISGALLLFTWFGSMFCFKSEMSSRRPTAIKPVEAL
jgi:hypothetical protein